MSEFKVYSCSVRAQQQFKKICVSSWNKCKNSEEAMNHKISRMANTGDFEVLGEVKLVHFQSLRLLIHNDEVININWDSVSKPFKVNEKYKMKYDNFAGGYEANEMSLREQLHHVKINIDKSEKYREKADKKLDSLYEQKDLLENIMADENLQLLNA